MLQVRSPELTIMSPGSTLMGLPESVVQVSARSAARTSLTRPERRNRAAASTPRPYATPVRFRPHPVRQLVFVKVQPSSGRYRVGASNEPQSSSNEFRISFLDIATSWMNASVPGGSDPGR